jgi:hypothetical protein
VLPAGFTVKRQVENPASNPQLQLAANTPSITDQQFAATVGTLPMGGLKEIGDYNLRATLTATYAPFTPASLPSGAVAFRTVSGPASFTVFWPHGTHYIELALSTDGGAAQIQLDTTYAQIMANWKWQ